MLDFFNLKPEVFGLDFSDLSLKVLKLEGKGGIFSLASFGETMITPGIIKRGEIRNKDNLIKFIQKAVAEVKGKKINTPYVIASLPEEKAFLEVIQMPLMSEVDLKSAVIFEAENYIPLPIEKVYLDFQIVVPLVNHLDHQDVLIAAFPRDIIDVYTHCLKAAGLKPVALEIESAAVARALIKNETVPFPILIIDFGQTKTTFIIFSGRALRYTFSIPDSPQKFTQAIANSMKIDLVEAEKLKLKYGLEADSTKESIEVFQILISYLNDFVEQIKKHIEYYKDHISHEHLLSNEKEIRKILLCGEEANLKGLPGFLERRLDIPTELGNPWVNIFKEEKKEMPKLLYEKSLKYTTVLGLALRGIKNYDARF